MTFFWHSFVDLTNCLQNLVRTPKITYRHWKWKWEFDMKSIPTHHQPWHERWSLGQASGFQKYPHPPPPPPPPPTPQTSQCWQDKCYCHKQVCDWSDNAPKVYIYIHSNMLQMSRYAQIFLLDLRNIYPSFVCALHNNEKVLFICLSCSCWEIA